MKTYSAIKFQKILWDVKLMFGLSICEKLELSKYNLSLWPTQYKMLTHANQQKWNLLFHLLTGITLGSESGGNHGLKRKPVLLGCFSANMRSRRRSITHDLTLLYKRLFPWFISMTSRSHDSNFIIVSKLLFNHQ